MLSLTLYLPAALIRLIVYWNEGAEAMFASSAEEALGQTTEFFYPDTVSFRRIYEIAAPNYGLTLGGYRFLSNSCIDWI